MNSRQWYHTHISMTKVQKTDNTNCWQWWGKQDLLHTAGGIQTGNKTLENDSFFRSNLWSIHKVALRLFTQINTKTVWPHTQMYKNVFSYTSRVESTQDPSRDEWVARLSYAQVNPHTMLLSMKRHETDTKESVSKQVTYCVSNSSCSGKGNTGKTTWKTNAHLELEREGWVADT